MKVSVINNIKYPRNVLESLLDPILVLDHDGIIVDTNEHLSVFIDISREKLLGIKFSSLFKQPKKFNSFLKKVEEKNTQLSEIMQMEYCDGRKTELLFNGIRYNDTKGNSIGAFILVRENRLSNTPTLHDMEYKNFINDRKDFACIANMNGQFEMVSENLEKMLGYTKKELTQNGFLEFVHPADIAGTIKEMEKLKKGKHTINFVNRYRKKNGDYLWIEWNGNPVGDKIYAIAKDVSIQVALKENLEHSLKDTSDYKYALDASSIVEITDEKGVMKYVNQNSSHISKYSIKELIGKKHQIVNSGYHPKSFFTELWSNISQGKIWKNEIKNKAKDGTYYWTLTTIIPFVDSKGKPYQYVAIRNDITKQKEVEEEILKEKIIADIERSRAEKAVGAKQQFLSNMSHEIRNPLNAIIGFTKVMLKSDLSSKQKEHLAAIKTSSDTLIVLINDILDLAKVESGNMTIEKIPFKLQSSIQTMIQLFEFKFQEKNIELVQKYDVKIPDVLLGDPMRLHQIMLNLMSNALKFTSKGKIKVETKLLKENKDTATIKFSFADTGIGISADKLNTIFENFQQATNQTSRLYGGTGLGLAIVKKLVELQGGTISVKSTIDKGTTFTFTLTFQKTDATVAIENDSIELDDSLKNIKVLVVEDVVLNQLLMKTLLDDFGFEFDIAENGEVAIEKLKSNRYDIVLMDIQMPVLNGYETTEYIRKIMKSNIPIIALTADVAEDDLAKCMAHGMNDFIPKPVDEKLLYQKILVTLKKQEKIIALSETSFIATTSTRYTNLDFLTQRTRNNSTMIVEMISAYLEQTPTLVSTIKDSFQKKDWHLLHAAVHKLIPSFAIVGIDPKYQDIALKIKDYAQSQNEIKNIYDQILELEKICQRSCQELEEELNNRKLN